DRLVLRLPAKPRDRSIISASVRHSNDAQVFSRCRSRRMARHDFSISYAVHCFQSKDLQGDSESRIPAPEFLFEVRVGQSLCGTSMSLSILETVRPAYHRKKLMPSAVGRSIRLLRKTYFPDRPELSEERWNRVRRAFSVWNQIEHRIFRRPLQIG